MSKQARTRTTPRKEALGRSRQASQEHGRGRVQACSAWPHLPEVFLRCIRGTTPEVGGRQGRVREGLLRASLNSVEVPPRQGKASDDWQRRGRCHGGNRERQSCKFAGVLPGVYAQEKLDKQSPGGLIDLIGSATLGTREARSKDVLGPCCGSGGMFVQSEKFVEAHHRPSDRISQES